MRKLLSENFRNFEFTLDYRIKVPVLWKKTPKNWSGTQFFCGTFEVNTKFLVAVLLFHYPYSTAKVSLEVHRSQLPEFIALWRPPKNALLKIICRS